MRDDADLSLRGLARLEAEFLETLDLREVILVGNDLGLFQVTACEYPERIALLSPDAAWEASVSSAHL